MKFNFHVSPNIKGALTTQNIMKELTIGLLVVFACGCAYYTSAFGISYGMHAIVLLACSLATTFVCEMIFAKIMKKDVKTFIKNSFGWVTAIILTMMVPISLKPYAIIIATIFAIVVARLLFGGFGNNIFNPAAVGMAVVSSAFPTARIADLMTSATPTGVVANAYHWLPANETVLQSFLDSFHGFSSLAIGTYPGAIGETFTILILVIGVVLAVRNVIDWRVPTVYLGTIAVMTAIIAVLTGLGSYHGIPAIIWYPALHLVTGGIVYGAVFMLTDPVTNPTSAAGRVLFAMGAAILTVLLRMNSNLPEGCMFSILLMNMFTPMIEQALDGKQLDLKKKVYKMAACFAIVALGVAFYAASSVEPVSQVASVLVEEMGAIL